MGSLKQKTKQFCDSKFKQFSDSGIADIHSRVHRFVGHRFVVHRFVGQNAIAESSVNAYSCLQYVANVPYSE